jgi:mono/diheme cytochrome c family protein
MKRLAWLMGGLSALLAACSLAGDVTPPPGARPRSESSAPSLPTPVTIEVSAAVPASRPSAAAGSVIYAQRCADCHGATGESDGVRVAQLPAAPPKFSQPETLRAFTPRDLYGVVTLGRLDKLMPPFAEALTDAERWDVVAYLYTLSTSQTQMDEGQALYAANCAGCHGADGAQLRDWTMPEYLAVTSPMQAFAAISDGVPEMEAHAFAPRLSEADRWAVINFARTLTYDYLAPGAPLPQQTGQVLGQVANGTAGGSAPNGLVVTLIGFTDTTMAETLTTTVRAEGQFAFEAVPFVAGEQFILTTDYRGVTYHSEVFSFESGQPRKQMPVVIYEVTESAANLRIEQLHTFLMFEAPGEVTVGQMAIVSNDGDATYAPAKGETVQFAVPAGAADVASPDGLEGETYFVKPEGYVDTRPVPPGEGTLQVFYQYRLPYSGQLNFEQRLDYPTTGVNLLVGDARLALSGVGMQSLGTRDMQGLIFQQFQRSGLNAGDTLTFQLSGNVGAAAAPSPTLNLSTGSALSVGLGLGAVVALLAAVGIWRFRRPPASPRFSANGYGSREELLDALAELDDDFAAGRVTQRDYEQERAWLKTQVKQVWQRGE